MVKTRYLYIYRPLQDKRSGEYPERVAVNEAARKLARRKPEIDDDEPSTVGFGTTRLQGRQRWQESLILQMTHSRASSQSSPRPAIGARHAAPTMTRYPSRMSDRRDP